MCKNKSQINKVIFRPLYIQKTVQGSLKSNTKWVK